MDWIGSVVWFLLLVLFCYFSVLVFTVLYGMIQMQTVLHEPEINIGPVK